MRKLSLTYLAVLILVSGVGLARAQDSVSTEQIALIKELVETTGGKQQFNEIMSNSISLQREQYKEIFESLSTNDAGVTSAEKKLIAEMVNESLERITARSQEFFTKKFDFDKFVDNVYVPAYSKHFTTGELRDLISFYHTST